ncbi:MAG TPA: DMT family transporter [Candidatus Sulfopaludibacter sp.]|nr:DMT family transporter [Candidatus Sulfopaludibacter sp.]
MTRRTAAEAALAGNTIVWGATFVLVKAALRDVSPILFVALRFGLAALVLLPVFGVRAARQFSWKAAAIGALAGTFLFGGYFFQTMGLGLTTAPKSAFITGLASILVPLLGSLVYRLRPQRSEWMGVVLATMGLGLMTWQGDFGSIGRGDLLTFFCAVAFAGHVLTLGRFAPHVGFELLAIIQVITAAMWATILFRGMEQPHVEWRPAVVYAILITGILCTALAFSVQAWAQQHTTSTRTALIYLLEPVVAWVTSYFWAGEGLSGRGAAGAALILGGVLMVELKPWSERSHPLR